ncbi:hypothetical protein GBAR_LOCUS29304 [Geodia barretti]|uniref:E3 ubiquitin-protein ligase listerin HEAT-repeats region domain-containing protein n=1 Tax=Geodia barretti TaxID=519541 RepID=A0AA35TSD8_GEOBA|nr:hypothetical protein GBAR_LOCUS29304 [Geodia barretti]
MGRGGVRGEDTFLWRFLDLCLTSTGSFEGEQEMKRSVFEIISKTLQIALQPPQLQSEEEKGVRPEREVGPQPAIMKLLQTLARTSADVVEDYFTFRSDNGSALLCSMLHWCLDHCRREESTGSILAAVFQCYSHLVALLPEPASYLESSAALLSSLLHNDLDRVLAMAVAVDLLHSPALNSYCTFWSFYQPLRPQSPAQKTGYLSLGALETYCSNQSYSPLFTDLSASNVVTTLTGSGLSGLFLATALCKRPTLASTLSSLEFDASLGDMILNSDGAPTNLNIAFPDSGSQEEKGSYYRLWKATVCDLMLALCALQPSKASSQSHTEEEVVSVLTSALQQCLVLGSRDHHEWNTQMLDALIERASMEGPLWCEVLKQFISVLESSVDEEDRLTVLPDFISVVLRDMEPGLVLAAISGLSNEGKREVEGRLMACIRGRESDLCLLCACLHLLPKFRSDLLSLARGGLSSVASQHSSSEINLFDSLGESVQDPMVYSLLDLISLLCADQTVPSDAWDFILCALVTITHLVSEATPSQRNSVNYTVFYCKAMAACHDVASVLTSPSSPDQQAGDWKEFFAPDINSCLLPAFLNRATQTTPDSLPSHCDVLQSYHLSRTAAEVCSSPTEGVSLEFLVDIFFSPLNPFRITAFLLAQRLVSVLQFTVEGSTSSTEKAKDTTKTITYVRPYV